MVAKLYYYAAGGRAMQIRLTLAASGIPFEDVCASAFPPSAEDRAMWTAIGKNTTTNVPMVVMDDGAVYTQSSAALRAVARRGRLMPTNDEELYTVDKLIADADDLRAAAYKTFVVWGAPQEEADKFISTVLPTHLENFERQLKGSSGDYFVGDKLTVADLTVYDAVVNFGANRVPGALDDFKALKAWTERVEHNSVIKVYLASKEYSKLYKFGPETLGK
mmetsp:Transcript_23996/g.48561  ORF Transcript_23996/g.48561 Transcript_23996/m.48561 type:complete len:220 (-) Transcript_23996:196-855(-)